MPKMMNTLTCFNQYLRACLPIRMLTLMTRTQSNLGLSGTAVSGVMNSCVKWILNSLLMRVIWSGLINMLLISRKPFRSYWMKSLMLDLTLKNWRKLTLTRNYRARKMLKYCINWYTRGLSLLPMGLKRCTRNFSKETLAIAQGYCVKCNLSFQWAIRQTLKYQKQEFTALNAISNLFLMM